MLLNASKFTFHVSGEFARFQGEGGGGEREREIEKERGG